MTSALLCENDLAPCRHLIELTDRDDVGNLGDEIGSCEAEEVDRRFAGVELAAGIDDHFQEFGDRRDVQLFHLALQIVRHDTGHARKAAEPGWPPYHRHELRWP